MLSYLFLDHPRLLLLNESTWMNIYESKFWFDDEVISNILRPFNVLFDSIDDLKAGQKMV